MGTSATARLIEGVCLIRCPLNTGFTVLSLFYTTEKGRSRVHRGLQSAHSSKNNFFDIPANALRLPLFPIMALGVRLIQVGNNRNDHFRYFLGVRVRLIEVSA